MVKKNRLLYVCAGLLLFLAACASSASGNPTPTPLPALVSYEKTIFKVEQGPITSEQKILAEIVPSKQDDLFFRAGGYVTRVTVKRGDRVKKGDVLAELQIDDLMNQLQQTRIDLEVSQANYTKDKTQHQYDVDQATADVAIWEKRLQLDTITVSQTYGIDKEKAQLNLGITQQNLDLARKNLQLVTSESNPSMEQAVKRSELAVQRLEGLIAERQIIAPYDGIILKSTLQPGRQVDAFLVGFTIGDPSNMIVRAQYDYDLSTKMSKESDVKLYLGTDTKNGYAVQYMPDFLPVSSQANSGSDSQTSAIGASSSSSDYLYFTLPEQIAKDDKSVGRQVSLVIVLGHKDNALLLPPAAIREYKGLFFVIVQDGDKRRRVEIQEIGLKSTDRWEVIADLQPGDQVVGP
ncbi:MAG: efflux RND transporter periplasmic adaptor subunit [Omnitrophica WOR_2 bacterium]